MKRILCAAAALVFLLCGCSGPDEPNGKQVTGERFASEAEALGLQVNDQAEDAPGEYETYLTAHSAETTAEFMLVADESTSVQLYGSQKDTISQLYTEGDERSETRGKTYTKFTLRTQDNVYILVRVERSVLLVSGTLNGEKTAKKLLANIGY